MEWISVKERLPSDHCIVKIKNKNGLECEAYYWKDGANWLQFYCSPTLISSFQERKTKDFLFDVTHWMPLPNPPKE